MTDGILLRELEHDRLLRRYDTLIIDEAHERSLNIDFLLGVLKRVLPQRPELRVIITSATIDPQRFAEFFGGAPIIEVSGRSYPVEVRYRPLIGERRRGRAVARPKASSPPCRSWIARIAATCSSSCRARNRFAMSSEALRQGEAASHRGAAAVCAPVDARSGADLREARRASRRARDQRRGDIADRAGHSPRRRLGPRAHQPLQRARQGAAPADRADLAGQRRSAQGPLRPRKRRASAFAVCGRRLRPHGRRSRRRRSCARISRASSCRWRRSELGEPRGLSVRRSARHAADQRRLSAAAGAEGRRRSSHVSRASAGRSRRCRSIRGSRACCWRRVITLRGEMLVIAAFLAARIRASGRPMRRRRPIRSTRRSPIRARTSSPC